MNVLVWLRNDLRVSDHPALGAGAALGRVLPLVIEDPADWCGPTRSGRQWAFRAESLAGLREALAALGAPLVLRVGDPVAVLATLCRTARIGQILAVEDPACRATDARIAMWAGAAGVPFRLLPPTEAEAPAGLSPLPGVEPGPIPPARALRLAEDRCPHRQPGGRAQGLLLLQGFLEARGAGYAEGRGAALLAERACSRLSPHLTAGTLSRAEVARAVRLRLAERPGPGWRRGLSLFRQGLVPAPDDGDAPSEAGEACHLAAFAAAETGLPLVDAALRCLGATGWLPARLRALLISVGVHHLRLSEAAAGAVLARGLTDFAPPVHWAAVRRAALARPLDPASVAAAADPEGGFTRRWLPELAAVPDACLQAPWRWPEARHLLGRRYPEPVVNPAAAARARGRDAPLQLCLGL